MGRGSERLPLVLQAFATQRPGIATHPHPKSGPLPLRHPKWRIADAIVHVEHIAHTGVLSAVLQELRRASSPLLTVSATFRVVLSSTPITVPQIPFRLLYLKATPRPVLF